MRIPLATGVVLLVAASVAGAARVADLSWLSGCWASAGQDEGSGEVWMKPSGGSLFGVSRVVRGPKTVAWEFMRIVETEDGGVDFIASPSGQAAARFRLVEMSPERVVFENPEHDFPQRVIYQLLDDDRLLGRIEGTVEGELRSVDFPMRRERCVDGGD